MTTELRIVFDAGPIVSAALLPDSVPRKAFDAAAAVGRLLVSDAVIAELHEVLRRPKFDKYASEEKRLDFLAVLLREAELVSVTTSLRACRDPKDDKFLELAVDGSATHLVTGDADLLTLHPCRGVAIVTPQDFLSIVNPPKQ